MTAGNRHQLFRLKRTLVGGQRKIGDRNGIVERDNHEQWRGRDAWEPHAGFVHARGPSRASRDVVVPNALRQWLQVEVDCIL